MYSKDGIQVLDFLNSIFGFYVYFSRAGLVR